MRDIVYSEFIISEFFFGNDSTRIHEIGGVISCKLPENRSNILFYQWADLIRIDFTKLCLTLKGLIEYKIEYQFHISIFIAIHSVILYL